MHEYIERDKALAETWKEPRYTDVMNVLTEIRDRIRSLPSADVQPVVHGEWIKTMEGNAFRDKCSECESLYPNAFGYNFCPNCGADMRGKGGK